MHHFIFVWVPYEGKAGERVVLGQSTYNTLQGALQVAIENRDLWRKAYGEGQAVVAKIESYIAL